jgi:steroid 5-alpha reductase family enzyme
VLDMASKIFDFYPAFSLEWVPIMPKSDTSKSYILKSFSWITLTYVAALAAAIMAIGIFEDFSLVMRTFLADSAATLVVNLSGRIFRNSSFYDPYWSVAPILIALYWLVLAVDHPAISWTKLLVFALVCIWGLRLTINWAAQWQGLQHEDWRYVQYRHTSGSLFWLIELVGIDFVPTIVVFLGCLSLFPILTADQFHFGPLQVVATVVTAVAILLESTADRQLKNFLQCGNPSQNIMQIGLWNYSRHPNYLGEILFWWGLWLFVPGFGPPKWLALLGPLSVTALFIFVSIPLMEKRNLVRRPGYAEHVRRVPVLIPWFPKH